MNTENKTLSKLMRRESCVKEKTSDLRAKSLGSNSASCERQGGFVESEDIAHSPQGLGEITYFL